MSKDKKTANEYLHCPICWNTKKDDEEMCPTCGFKHVSIDLSKNSDISYIREIQKRDGHVVWDITTKRTAIVLFIIALLISPVISYLILKDNHYGTPVSFYSNEFIRYLSICLIASLSIAGIMVYITVAERERALNRFIKERKTIVSQIEQEKKYRERQKELIEKFGEGFLSLGYNLYVNERTKKIYIGSNSYNFSDILDYSVKDNAVTIHSASKSKEKTNTGSMIGRAVVGGVLMGNLGALIGGATASKTIQQADSQSTVSHDYSVIITVNNLSSPLEIIRLGKDEMSLNKIVATLTIVLNNN